MGSFPAKTLSGVTSDLGLDPWPWDHAGGMEQVWPEGTGQGNKTSKQELLLFLHVDRKHPSSCV